MYILWWYLMLSISPKLEMFKVYLFLFFDFFFQPSRNLKTETSSQILYCKCQQRTNTMVSINTWICDQYNFLKKTSLIALLHEHEDYMNNNLYIYISWETTRELQFQTSLNWTKYVCTNSWKSFNYSIFRQRTPTYLKTTHVKHNQLYKYQSHWTWFRSPCSLKISKIFIKRILCILTRRNWFFHCFFGDYGGSNRAKILSRVWWWLLNTSTWWKTSPRRRRWFNQNSRLFPFTFIPHR